MLTKEGPDLAGSQKLCGTRKEVDSDRSCSLYGKRNDKNFKLLA